MRFSDAVAISIRAYFSIDLVLGAAHQSREAGRLEPTAQLGQQSAHVHRSHVVSSFLMLAAFLEATVNEFLSDSDEEITGETVAGLPRTEVERLGRLWRIDSVARGSVISKYELVLAALGRPQFKKNDRVYEDVAGVVSVRNAIAHYKLRSFTVSSGIPEMPITVDALEQRLRSRRIAPCQYADRSSLYFPDRLLGHGYSAWAGNACVAFVDDFFGRLGHRPPVYDPFRSEMTF